MMGKQIYIIAAVLVVGIGAFFWLQTPPANNSNSMTQPDLSDIDDGDPIAKVKIPSVLSANAEIGKQIFEAACAACHGVNASGQKGVAPPLVHKIYEPGHHGEGAFLSAAKNGVTAHHWNFGKMPPVSGITGGDVKMVVAYIRELQRENGID